jgi:hypothetical protein
MKGNTARVQISRTETAIKIKGSADFVAAMTTAPHTVYRDVPAVAAGTVVMPAIEAYH